MLLFILEQLQLAPSIVCAEVGNDSLRSFVSLCKQFRFQVNGTLSLEQAFVTGGGVSVKEIDPKTMESKKKKGLYFCGEVIDIHGYTGGYNITVAFSTGYTAGHAATKQLV